jgi:hypothetical protein
METTKTKMTTCGKRKGPPQPRFDPLPAPAIPKPRSSGEPKLIRAISWNHKPSVPGPGRRSGYKHARNYSKATK